MADTTYFVNTASAGGDGTGGIDVIAGATAAYASLSSAEAARQGTVNIGDRVVFKCKGTAADTTAAVWSGWTINGEVILTSDLSSRHTGTYDTGKYRLESTSNVLTLSDENITVEYLQLKKATTNTRRVVLCGSGSTNAKILRNVIFQDFGGTSIAVSSSASANPIVVAFNVIIDCTIAFEDSSSQGGFAMWFNNTIVNCSTIFTATKTNKPTFKNNLIQNSTNGITGTIDSSSDYNATDSATFGTGYSTNTNDRVSQAFSFVNAGAGDYHLQSGDTGAKGFGVDLSGTIDAIDIDGETIVAPWSIGADWVSAGGGSTPLSVDNITSSQTTSSPTLTQSNALSVDGVVSDQALSESALLVGVQLSVNSIISAQLIGQPILDQNNLLQVNPVLNEQVITSPSFTQANILSVDNLTTGQTLSQVVLSIAGVLSVDGISTAQTIANIEMIEHSLLSVNDISSDQSVENVTFVSGDQLVVQSITSGQAISGTNFTQHNIILVDPITNTQFIGVVNIGGDDKNIGIISVGFKSADIGVKYGILNITVQFKE